MSQTSHLLPSIALAAVTALGAAASPSTVLAHAHRHHVRGHLLLSSRPLLERISNGEPKNTAIVMDARTGEVLYAERADSQRYPASVTKVMTMYLAFEALASGKLHLTDPVIVSPLAAAQPATKLGLRAGETITVENALHAMAVHSANDMAVAIAEKVGGTSSRFADMMTLKAQQLGMTNTRYVNPNGLPDNRQVSTAHDLAILARAVLRDYPQYYNFFSQEEFTYRGKTMYNTNHLLGKVPGVDGLKTGFTNAAGFNLAASAMRNGHRLIAVVMGNPSGGTRNALVENLLLTGFDIEDRRDRGERILATQTYFETGGRGQPAEPVLARAETAGDPIDVVLTRTTAPSQAITVSPSMQKAQAAASARSWWVQVGQFHSRKAAHRQVVAVSHQFAGVLENAEGSVEGRGHAYRARFSGLSETGAKQACAAIKGHGLACAANGRG